MLPRAALRAAAVRTTTARPLLRAFPSIATRSYAHFNNPKFPPKKPSSGSGINSAYQPPNKPSSQRPTDFARSSTRDSAGGERNAVENERIEDVAEHNTKATPEANTAPRSQPGPDVAQKAAPQAPTSKESDGMEPEFEGPKSAEENTAPSSQPKQAQQPEPEPPLTEEHQAPKGPLPDLRHGIPSTFAQEFGKVQARTQPSEAERDSAKLEEEIEHAKEQDEKQQAEAAAGGRASGELPKSAYETSTDRRRNKVMNWVYVCFAVMGTTGAVFLGRNWESEEEAKRHADIPSGWGWNIFWDRIKARVSESMGYYTEPTFPKLLPTMDPAPPYTLVVSLEDLMIHSEWTRQNGYRTAKRPGLDYFIRYLSQYYEIVMFTSLPMSQAEPVYRKLDPYHIIMWPLFREATRYHKGRYIKDLSYLNRDLSKVIVLDTKGEHVQAQPENAIILPPWKGDPKDRDLVSYVPFLEHIAAMGVPDVRRAIASFDGKHIPTEYAAREGRARVEFKKQLEEERAKKPRHSLGALVGKSLGLKAQPAPGSMIMGDDGTTASEGFEKGLMLSDQIRERGRKAYEQMEMQIRQEGEKWLKEMEEEEKKAQEEFSKNMKGSFVGWFGGKAEPPPPPHPSATGGQTK